MCFQGALGVETKSSAKAFHMWNCSIQAYVLNLENFLLFFLPLPFAKKDMVKLFIPPNVIYVAQVSFGTLSVQESINLKKKSFSETSQICQQLSRS